MEGGVSDWEGGSDLTPDMYCDPEGGRVDLVLVMCELGLLGTFRQLHQLGLLPEHDQGLPLLINEVTI